MTIGTVLLGLALLVLVLLFLARPFMARATRPQRITRRQALLAQKEVVLDQLKLLDFDAETGKVPEDIYQEQREHLLEEASEILQQLDKLEGRVKADSHSQYDDIDAEIEAAIAGFRQVSPRLESSNGRGQFCTQCGQPADTSDIFCAHCGHRLRTQHAA
jgi:hypothetical protein